jgi:hypothetical protein
VSVSEVKEMLPGIYDLGVTFNHVAEKRYLLRVLGRNKSKCFAKDSMGILLDFVKLERRLASK